jgi:mycofactocin precursor
MTVTEPTTETQAEPVEDEVAEELVTDEVLVEEISIDGMCGVY